MSIKVEVQTGRQQCKNNALMSASRKFRSLCINMTLPLGKKWHSCRVDCRAGLATLAREHCRRIWRREKSLLLPVGAEYTMVEWNRWIIWAWNQILWHLNIEMVSFIFRYVESNLCRIEMNNGTACGIRFGRSQHATSRLFLFVFFLLENMHRWVFSEEFHEVSMLVLLGIAAQPFGVCARAGLKLFIYLEVWLHMCTLWWLVGM